MLASNWSQRQSVVIITTRLVSILLNDGVNLEAVRTFPSISHGTFFLLVLARHRFCYIECFFPFSFSLLYLFFMAFYFKMNKTTKDSERERFVTNRWKPLETVEIFERLVKIIFFRFSFSVERIGWIMSVTISDGSSCGVVVLAREEPADPLRHLQRCAPTQLRCLHYERRERRSGDDLIHHIENISILYLLFDICWI